MPAELIDGAAIARAIREEAAEGAAVLRERGVVPGLTVVLVGDDPASAVYVRSKERACIEAGMNGVTIRLPADTPQAELIALVDRLNADPAVHGILVQMPLPRHMDADAVIHRIDPAKDVDGFHPVNVGKLLIGGGDGFVPCTPAGVMEMLRRSGVDTRGAECVVVGRSNIVGKPMAALLVQPGADATVTICHSRTRDLASHVRRADVLVAAVGRAEMITGDMLKPGAVVIDVGMNRVADAASARGYRLTGDVHFASACEVASKITPVPGGVGPMTIAMLLRNTLEAARAGGGAVVDLRRLRAGEWLALAGGVLLIVSLFLPWYGDVSGLEAMSIIDILLVLIAAVAITLPVLQATQTSPALPVAFGVLTATTGAIGVLLVVFRLIDSPGEVGGVASGAWLGLASALALTVGGWRAIANEHVPHLPPGPEPELRPAPGS